MTRLIERAAKALEGATLGPWEADTNDPGDCVVFAGDADFVANIGRSRIQSLVVAFDCDASNARLIALAPDLARLAVAARELADAVAEMDAAFWSDGNVTERHLRACKAGVAMQSALARFRAIAEGRE